MISTETAGAEGLREQERTERRDPRLPLADMFDPVITQRLWESLPAECRVDHINKENIPEIYRKAIRFKNADAPWTTNYLNIRDLPETMTWEIAWLLYREIELGRFVNPGVFNCATRVLRIATEHGSKRGRSAQSLLHLTAEEWIGEVQTARMRGVECGIKTSKFAFHRIRQLQDVLVYPYHRGQWWELDVWNPQLDARIPQREHEPYGRDALNFIHFNSAWLRDGAKLWLSANLANGTMSWSSARTRYENLKWLQRHLDQRADEGPCLTTDPHQLRPFIRSFCEMLLTHRVPEGRPNAGQPIVKNSRRQIMVGIEQFYRWMYDHRDEAAAIHPGLAMLRPEHCVLFRPDDKPRLTNKKSDDMVLDDDVVQRIAEGCDLLARPRSEGGCGDIQAFHALMLLIRTGRRLNEVLMMDFDPLIPLHRPPDSPATGSQQLEDFVARMRYQQTKIESNLPSSIPVDAEVVTIIRAQQQVARDFMAAMGSPGTQPGYLFLRTRINRNGTASYPMSTMHGRLKELTEKLAITDSAGRPVHISKTHRFRHTAATNLINAGVPLHVVMRYFGHVSPEMTLHYAVTRSRTMEEEFLKYKKVTLDGRTAEIDGTDLYDLIQLDKRADRILPNGWCTLPPKQLCDKGNACLTCPKFVTDATHASELCRQLEATERLLITRQEAFTAKYGAPMGEDNVWLQGRRDEIDSLNRILLSITDVTDRAVRGAGVTDQPA
jgi:integrase